MGNCCNVGSSTAAESGDITPLGSRQLSSEHRRLYLNTIADKDILHEKEADGTNKNITSDETSHS